MHAKNVWILARDPEVSLAAHRLRARSVGAARAARGKAPGGIPAQFHFIYQLYPETNLLTNPTQPVAVLYCRPALHLTAVANLVVRCTT